MGLYIKKQFPFTLEPVDCYLKITDVYFETSDKEVWKIKYSIFPNKDVSDLLKKFLYISTVWMTDPNNTVKISGKVSDWLNKNLFQIVNKTTAMEEGLVIIPVNFTLYQYKSLPELMDAIYGQLKTNCNLIDASFSSDDLESREQFEERVIGPFMEELNKKMGD
jgi:hypothetical protein